ncbi:IS30 family transposase [bacterium]|nr:IS30 family transposase [bacterium]
MLRRDLLDRITELERRLCLAVHFAHPCNSWERGLNENANGLLRQFLPKKTDFRDLSEKALAKIERLLNNRPRKCLGYRTPHEVFHAPPVALQM